MCPPGMRRARRHWRSFVATSRCAHCNWNTRWSSATWNPNSPGLLSGKYRRGADAAAMADGRLKATAGRSNPIFDRFTGKNWSIVAELESVAKEVDRSLSQVAINWVAHRPGVASVILGATKLPQ